MAWQILRPILAANGGWAIFTGTPRGKNHFNDMLLQAKSDPSWFWSVDTAVTTGVLSQEVLDKEKSEMDTRHFHLSPGPKWCIIGVLRSALMNPSYAKTKSDSTDQGTRLAFQTVAFISLAGILGERGWRLLRDLNRVYHFTGRG